MLNTIVPIFSAGVAAGADFESIATVTIGSGGAASAEFTSIPSGYAHLQVRALMRGNRAANSADVVVQFNSDTANNYSSHQLYADGAGVSSSAFTTRANFYTGVAPAASATASIFGVFVLDILDYANTNKYKTARALAGEDRNGSGDVTFNSGLWMSTSAITSIKIYPTANDFVQYSHFALYGIKSA